MRIASWNVNGLRARFDFVARWLAERRPDVVGLQELKVSDEGFPRAELEALGYHAAVHGQKGWNGVAILARTPLEATRRGLPGQEDFGARLITAQVCGLSFTTVYVPNGKSLDHEDYARKLAWLDALRAHWTASRNPAQPAVLCGDLNVVPSGIDSWNEEALAGRIFHSEPERERFAALLGAGLVDLFREVHPGEQVFSWWDYRGGAFHKKHGLRIDFLLGTRAVLERVRCVAIDREYRKKKDGLTASDHAPVIADLAEGPAEG